MLEGGGDRQLFGPTASATRAPFVRVSGQAGRAVWRPVGDGRPGWHSECFVKDRLLGEGFDLHCAAKTFGTAPENERAQSVAFGQDVRQSLDAPSFVIDAGAREVEGSATSTCSTARRYDSRRTALLLQTHGPQSDRSYDNLTSASKTLAVSSLRGSVGPSRGPEPEVIRSSRVMDPTRHSAGTRCVDTVRRPRCVYPATGPRRTRRAPCRSLTPSGSTWAGTRAR